MLITSAAKTVHVQNVFYFETMGLWILVSVFTVFIMDEWRFTDLF